MVAEGGWTVLESKVTSMLDLKREKKKIWSELGLVI